MKSQIEETREYSISDIHQMIAEGEKQFTEGQWQDSNEMFRELEEELAQEDYNKEQTIK